MRTYIIVRRSSLVAILALALPIAARAGPLVTTFQTPEQAVRAVVQAAQDNDTPALLQLFGPMGGDIVESGDPAEDKNDRAEFARLAHEKLQITLDAAQPDRASFLIGNEAWPFPVPLVRIDGVWQFDTERGLKEILAHRIGENESDAIEICRGFVEAELEYASQYHDGAKILVYSEKGMSSPGRHDGLYWEETAGSLVPKSFAMANSVPYHGYYFRIMQSQGPDAPGGAFEYIVDGNMIGGFALVAWPAKYGVSGIKTFIVNHDGIVYEKYLGSDTATLVNQIARFNPDKSWSAVAE
jgi:DUF2950 family protein